MQANTLATWIIVLSACTFVYIFGVDKVIPIYKKLEFVSTCDTYKQKCIKQGYLTSEERDKFINTLKSKSIEVQEFTVPTTKQEWGTAITFTIRASYSQKELQPNFTKVDKTYNMTFQKDPVTLCEE